WTFISTDNLIENKVIVFCASAIGSGPTKSIPILWNGASTDRL
ncbi:12447_t:CDS:2, partial [Gigaspora rosea]